MLVVVGIICIVLFVVSAPVIVFVVSWSTGLSSSWAAAAIVQFPLAGVHGSQVCFCFYDNNIMFYVLSLRLFVIIFYFAIVLL